MIDALRTRIVSYFALSAHQRSGEGAAGPSLAGGKHELFEAIVTWQAEDFVSHRVWWKAASAPASRAISELQIESPGPYRLAD